MNNDLQEGGIHFPKLKNDALAAGKDLIYLSLLKDSPKKRELLPRFYKIKKESCLAVFVYLIQRL